MCVDIYLSNLKLLELENCSHCWS